MSKPLRVRRLTDQEGHQLQRIVRRGGGVSENSVVRWRRAMVVLASAGGNTVPAIARLVATSPDRVREMIHRFNETGMASLDPQWAGGRPRRITTEDEDFIVAAATARPEALGLSFTRWSLRKLAGYLGDNDDRPVTISPERLRQILRRHDITFQRTKTWKESNDPDRDAKLDRIEEALERRPAVFRLRRVRAAVRAPRGRLCMGVGEPSSAPASELSQTPRRASVPRLLLDQRRHAVGRGASPQVGDQHPRSAEVDTGPPP